jgi:hypothetical protein
MIGMHLQQIAHPVLPQLRVIENYSGQQRLDNLPF